MRGCMRHSIQLVKHRKFNGEYVYVCPKEKCSYKENEEGEII